ncbi:hypothetical protein ACGYLO_16710 [Sulfitobacter sp. 1A13353]|uniref:hypothetical protein n=1 Tax=Sulfitobacter sp. 1A13353 TaxID=3368568 RepID=UPI003746D29C
MTANELKQAAALAILAMSDSDKEAFIAMMEGGNDDAATTAAQSFAIEGAQRQVRMAHMALESSSIMGDLTEAVYDTMAAA